MLTDNAVPCNFSRVEVALLGELCQSEISIRTCAPKLAATCSESAFPHASFAEHRSLCRAKFARWSLPARVPQSEPWGFQTPPTCRPRRQTGASRMASKNVLKACGNCDSNLLHSCPDYSSYSWDVWEKFSGTYAAVPDHSIFEVLINSISSTVFVLPVFILAPPTSKIRPSVVVS